MDTPEDLMDISAGLGLMENTPIIPDLMNEVDEDDDIIIHMDLREPIKNLKKLVEQTSQMTLTYYQVWLQDSQMLEPHKNLVDQCVQGEGLVQINVQIHPAKRRINIVDVLKPTDDAVAQLALQKQAEMAEVDTEKPPVEQSTKITEQVVMRNESELELPIPTYQISKNVQEAVPEVSTPPPAKQRRIRPPAPAVEKNKPTPEPPAPVGGEPPKKKNVIRWFVDSNFKQDQIAMQIPENPEEWTRPQVLFWLKWAMRQFHMSSINLSDWQINGKELCAMTIAEFQQRVPNDPNDIFWTHLELLRKCKFVASIQKPSMMDEAAPQVLEPQPAIHKKPYRVGDNLEETVHGNLIGNRTGNNGQIQLWQFLLEMLTSKEHREVIQWSGNEGEFKLLNAEVVAQLWGEKKHKTTMTYEKLSRALRYYYDGDMISKVNGKRFTYRFVCDLKELIGYDAQQLAKLVEESDMIYDENSLQLD